MLEHAVQLARMAIAAQSIEDIVWRLAKSLGLTSRWLSLVGCSTDQRCPSQILLSTHSSRCLGRASKSDEDIVWSFRTRATDRWIHQTHQGASFPPGAALPLLYPIDSWHLRVPAASAMVRIQGAELVE